MRAFSIEPAEDGVVVVAPSAHRPAHLLVGVPLVFYLVLQLPSLAIWVRACVELAHSLGPVTGTLTGLALSAFGALLTLAPGLAGVFLVAYEYAGVERVSVSARGVRVKREVGSVGWTRRYSAGKVRDARLAPTDGLHTWWAPALGGLLFDYGKTTRGFGAALTSAEAERVLAVLKERLPDPEPDEEEAQEG